MTRMTRELSLVLAGASVLSVGYFAWAGRDFQKRDEEEAKKRVGTTRTGYHGFIFIHGGRTMAAGTRPTAMAGVSRSGFGTTASRVSGGGGGGGRIGGGG